MKVVVDVNVWISAILWNGLPEQVLQLAKEQKILIFVSQPLLIELETTLNRPKFQAKLKALNLTVENIINAINKIINLCPAISIDVPQLRDPKDTVILATALAANADMIITGDLDLLVLVEFNGIPILNPKDFLAYYENL